HPCPSAERKLRAQLPNSLCAKQLLVIKDLQSSRLGNLSYETLRNPVANRTARMAQIEALLADDPADPFLRYGLAMEYITAGDDATAAEHLLPLTADSTYVPAFHQAGQVLNRLNRVAEAADVLRRGISVARQQGNTHAEGEMSALLETL